MARAERIFVLRVGILVPQCDDPLTAVIVLKTIYDNHNSYPGDHNNLFSFKNQFCFVLTFYRPLPTTLRLKPSKTSHPTVVLDVRTSWTDVEMIRFVTDLG